MEYDPDRPNPVRTTASGHRFEVTRGTASAEELEVLAAAIDRLAALDSEQQLGPWVTGHRPGIGLRAWSSPDRWSHSLRGTWGNER